MKGMKRPWAGALAVGLAAAVIVLVVLAVTGGEEGRKAEQPALSGGVEAVAQARGLTPADVLAAAKTYVPSGKRDDYVMFSSGGHSGQVLVIGVPSMRLLKVIGVFTPEPWQGWGYGSKATAEVLKGGQVNGKDVLWGDTHHPALSETGGEYDGKWLFINDKANARVAVIDLRDFETKQIVKNPVAINDHGGTFVTPDSEWVIEGAQYATPLGWKYAPVESYADVYRGTVTFWKFDRSKGRILPDQSFALELPPYWQDLCDAGKKASEGWVFCNSLNTELATGGIELGKPPFEAGASQRDMDYLHIINLEKAKELVAAGKTTTVNGFKVLTLKTAAAEGVLFFAPEPKSPHGADVTPGGEYVVVGGKLDPHVTIYGIDKIKAAAEKVGPGTKRDRYGVPILPFDEVKEAQVELGLGPLHTVFDGKGYAYTSLFLDSAVARWTLGGPYQEKHDEPAWTLVQKLPVQYNIGHLAAAEGDTVSPDGRFVVALNKWSVDRFQSVGPLRPQNFQLIDVSGAGKGMQLLYDMPIGIGEPHSAQMIAADKLKPWDVYPKVGWDPTEQRAVVGAPMPGNERVVRNGKHVEVWMTAARSHFTPERVEVRNGDHVMWHITNIERAVDVVHGFAIPGYNINLSLEPGETATVEFTADRPGVYTYYCSEFCSALHLEMMGFFLVKP